jgi:hypothetical protein
VQGKIRKCDRIQVRYIIQKHPWAVAGMGTQHKIPVPRNGS